MNGKETEATVIPQIRQVFYDLYANFPAANAVNIGDLAYATDRLVLYRSNGAAWQAITSIGVGEGHITILPLSYEAIGAGTWEVSSQAAGEFFGNLRNNPPNDLNNLSYEVYLEAGTYTILLVSQYSDGGGIVDIDIEGAEVATFDTYNVAILYNQLNEDVGNVIATDGIKTITLRLDGKNGASAAFRLQFNYLVLWRTA